jgi:hypothetical protein
MILLHLFQFDKNLGFFVKLFFVSKKIHSSIDLVFKFCLAQSGPCYWQIRVYLVVFLVKMSF